MASKPVLSAMHADHPNPPEPLYKAFRARRKALGLTQQDVAELAAVSLPTIHNLESGDGNPTLRVLEDVAQVLGLELRVGIRQTGVDGWIGGWPDEFRKSMEKAAQGAWAASNSGEAPQDEDLPC